MSKYSVILPPDASAKRIPWLDDYVVAVGGSYAIDYPKVKVDDEEKTYINFVFDREQDAVLFALRWV